jgi:hypothetical protein
MKHHVARPQMFPFIFGFVHAKKIFFHVRENVIWQEVYTKKVSKKTPWYANELHIQIVYFIPRIQWHCPSRKQPPLD